MRLLSLVVPCLFVLLLAAALPAAGQTPSDDAGIQPHGAVLLGQAGVSGQVHRWAGLNAGFTHGRWGVAGEIHRGGGNGYASTYLGGGPLLRHWVHPRAEVRLSAGLAHYRERLDDGRDRNVTGPTAGLQLRAPAGPVTVVLGLTGWLGSYEGDDTPAAPVPGRGLRIIVGVGR